MNHPKFIIKKFIQGREEKYYFYLTAKNGQTIAQSELYSSKDACENGIASVQANAPQAEIDDQSEAM